jgi:hypothetical protein
MAYERWKSQSFSKIKSRKLKWLLKPFIPRGITVVTGDSGIGKSTFIIDLIARITTGDAMPQFSDLALDETLEGSALIICKEDDPGLVIKPRLRAAGADMSRVHMVVVQRSKLPDDYDVIESLDTGIERLERIIQDIGDVRAILIDPSRVLLANSTSIATTTLGDW